MQNALFAAFSAQVARLTAKGASASDVARIEKWATPEVCDFVAPALDAGVIAAMTNQKAIMRLAQACAFITNTTNPKHFDKGSSLVVSAIALTTKNTGISFSQMHHIMGAKGDDNTVALPRVSRAKLSRFLGLISSAGTVTSQCSRTVGAGGFLTALGITRGVGKTAFDVVKRDHPFLIAYAVALDSMTDGTLALVKGDE